jgi:hypothetical protein
MATKLHTTSNGGSVTIIHVSSDDVSRLNDIFARAIQLSDGTIGWELPDWLLSMRQTVDLATKG